MRLKKLSLAAAISIGLLTVGGLANAACPVCPQQSMIPQEPCPVQQTMCPSCQQAPCACPIPSTSCVPAPTCVSACTPNEHPNAEILKRQVYGYPAIGGSSVVIPKGRGLLQIGGARERVAQGNLTPSGLTAYPEASTALTLFPKDMTGGAAPTPRGCSAAPRAPYQIVQGVDILRCPIPSNSPIFKSSCLESLTGKAVPITIAPCDPCSGPIAASPCEAFSLTSKSRTAYGNFPTSISASSLDPYLSLYAPASVSMMSSGTSNITGGAAPYSFRGNSIPIQTASGIPVQQTVMVPCEQPSTPSATMPSQTGAACPVSEQFPDVSNNMFAGCDINKLATAGVLAGYPDRTYKPNLPILRSELASALVGGLQLENVPGFNQQIFKDVSKKHWAKSDIDKAYNRGLMAGYPDDSFKPNNSVTRAEALSSMSKVIPGCMSTADAQNVLKSYADANELPGWATLPVAESLNAGLIKNLPDSTHIRPNDSATRAEIASMIKELRVALCLEPAATTAACAPCAPTGAAAYQPKVMCSTIPTLKVKMEDIVSARTSEVGDIFRARTTEQVTINSLTFPVHSIVSGRVVEVIRPTIGDHGAIRLVFDTIANENGDYKTALPKDVLATTVVKENNPNIIGRTLSVPFSLPGKALGIAGRTAGGALIVTANGVEGLGTNLGNGTNELFNGKIRAAGRSYLTAAKDVIRTPIDVLYTAGTGVAGTVKETFDEVAYIVSPDGRRIAQVNPREIMSIAFAAANTSNTACANTP